MPSPIPHRVRVALYGLAGADMHSTPCLLMNERSNLLVHSWWLEPLLRLRSQQQRVFTVTEHAIAFADQPQ